MPKATKKDFTALEIHRESLTVPGYLENAVVT